ncbi:hypothetical protein ABPG75_004946 [Micractinium tetrahymenae]
MIMMRGLCLLLLLLASAATGHAGRAGAFRSLLNTEVTCQKQPGPAYANEEIKDPAVTCVKGGPNYDAKGNYCPACYLYQRFSEGAPGRFVATGTPAQDHFLVLPTKPCSGVEMYAAAACGGDAALDYAWGLLSGPQKATKGVGVNGNHRRTQHQLHIHVADVQPSLAAALKGVTAGSAPTTIDCAARQATGCKVSTAAVTDRTPISAQCLSAADPSAAKAFERVYGGQPQAVIYSALLVTSPRPGDIWLTLGRLLFGRRQSARGAAIFDMDERLVQGKHWVCDLPLCRVLVCDDASYPCWLVLVPRANRAREVLDLDSAQRAQLWREVEAAARVVQDLYHPFKLNIAAIGNIVSQLHVHITGRLETDPAWPGPCYGAVPPEPLAPGAAAAVVSMLQEAFERVKLLPGPLALVQTEAGGDAATGSQEITHINGLSLAEIAAAWPRASPAEAGSAAALLTSVRRGGVEVQALMVVAVHAGLLPNSSAPTPAAGSAAGVPAGDAADADPAVAATEQRSLLRAAARLTWGLAGLVFELMHSAAGHWPSLGPVERQAVAGATLTQLYKLSRLLALCVLRAYGQLTPDRFAEMLESGLLPAPAKRASAADDACGGGDGGHVAARHDAEEAAAQV